MTQRLLGEVQTVRARLRAARLKAGGVLVDDLAVVLKAGEAPEADRLLAADAAAAEFPELDARLDRAIRLGEVAKALRRMPPAAVQAVLNELRARPTKRAADMELIATAEAVRQNQRTGLDRDPLSYGVRSGLITLAPIDPADNLLPAALMH